jgi:hypothetical protein
VVDAVDAIDSVDCCFFEMGCSAAGATTIVGCPPPLTRPFGFVFVVFKVNISSSLGIAPAAGTVCLDCVEAGGLEFSLTIEAQDFFIECIGTL